MSDIERDCLRRSDWLVCGSTLILLAIFVVTAVLFAGPFGAVFGLPVAMSVGISVGQHSVRRALSEPEGGKL